MNDKNEKKLNLKKSNTPTFDQLPIFKEISLYDIFSNEDVEILLKDQNFNFDAFNNKSCRKNSENISSLDINYVNKTASLNFMFDRMTLIMKLLHYSIEILKLMNEKVACHGLEWVKKEVEDIFVTRTDEKTLDHLIKIKEENRDIHNILNWVEEFSNLNQNQKEMLTSLKNKNQIASTPKGNVKSPLIFPYSTNYDILITDKEEKQNEKENYKDSNYIINSESYNALSQIQDPNNFLNINEAMIQQIDSPSFDIFEFEKNVGQQNTLTTISCFIFASLGLYSIIDYSNFENFLDEITKGYNRKNAYHTDLHAADVEQTCFIYLKHGLLKETLYLTDLDCAAFLISAIIHDFKHPGLNNNFLINSKNEIALRYNDQSILENFHVSESFNIIVNHRHCDIFSELSQDDFKIMRKRIIECVLATDMSLHNKEYSYLKLKKETYQISNGGNVQKIFENLDNITMFKTQQEFLNTLVHSADISNPTKPLDVYKNWTNLVMEEFWLQGDKEKILKLPVSFMCDRSTTKIPDSQLGFIDGIVSPLIQVIVEFFPNLIFLIENLKINKIHYKELKQQQDNLTANKI